MKQFKRAQVFRELSAEKIHQLYFTSDDEIKEGDWYYSSKSNAVYQKGANKESFYPDFESFCKKIIATTDTSLKEIIKRHNDFDSVYNLPQPSQQFIEKYIESYNRNDVITDVLVEYEEKCSRCNYIHNCTDINSCNKQQWLKTNLKDNTITIKKLKDSWNREEIKKVFHLFADYIQPNTKEDHSQYDKWIEENL